MSLKLKIDILAQIWNILLKISEVHFKKKKRYPRYPMRVQRYTLLACWIEVKIAVDWKNSARAKSTKPNPTCSPNTAVVFNYFDR